MLAMTVGLIGLQYKAKVMIADGSSIGIGANVFHNTKDQAKLVGYPAKKMPSKYLFL